jgi:3-oxoadipate enol-lactonase
MAEPAIINTGSWAGFEQRLVAGPTCALGVRIGGPETGEAILLNHSILTSSAVWYRQAMLLAQRGYRVICLDTKGHGRSAAALAPYAMDDLVADNIAVLDALGIAQAHFIGVSQGGMIGFGLGVRHPERLQSLVIVAARADAPAPFAAAWDDRIALVQTERSVDKLAAPTAERWFGMEFLAKHPAEADSLLRCIRETSAEGFIGCARAIQGLAYLEEVRKIPVRTTLIVGERDILLLQPMRDLALMLQNVVLHEIPSGGHLPQVDQPEAFNRLMLDHFKPASIST